MKFFFQVMWGKKGGALQKEWQPGKSLIEIWVKDSYNKTAHIPTFIYSIDIHTYIYISKGKYHYILLRAHFDFILFIYSYKVDA